MISVPVSVIVVSRGRPDALTRCLMGIAQLDYSDFELVVVADLAGCAAVQGLNFAAIKVVSFDEPDISTARNLGLQQAAGEVVAFIDDDAVPEPTWLTFLSAPFEDENVAAAGGFVRGRNGISFQYRARWVDAFGAHRDLAIGHASQVFDPPEGGAIKTEGTNCAFRRDVLAEIGGFDPAFPFYMDETDVNLRLAAGGHKTAIVPQAEVHHGFAASSQRHASRMPRSLFDVGASQMVLLRKHAPGSDPAPVLEKLRAEQKARLLRHMVAGNCVPGDVSKIMPTLEAGIAAGRTREIIEPKPISSAKMAFLRFKPKVALTGSDWLSGRIWQAKKLRAKAAQKVASGQRTSLFLFSPTALYHRVKFTDDGVWEQAGGLWGRAERSDPIFALTGFRERVRREVNRVEMVRKLPK